MEKETIEAQLRKIFIEEIGFEESDLTMTAHLIDDIGLDSLDAVEIVMAAEEHFGIEIPDEDVDTLRTFGDAVKYLESRVR